MKKRLEINKTAITVISLNVLQIVAVLSVAAYIYFAGTRSVTMSRYAGLALLLIVIVLTISLNSLIAVRNRQEMKNADTQFNLLKETLNQVENLNKTLRAQRHDFMNHLQVVYSLMEMEEYKDAKDYIDKVYGNIQKVGKILKTSNPAVNALLQAKLLSCEKRNIEAELVVSTKLDGLKIPSWELCKVLGNLIDNSICALLESPGRKLLTVELYENVSSLGIKVKNNGPLIPGDVIEKIFDAGFTTKGTKGEGMGLAITKETLNEYGGSIKVNSSETETVFEVIIPQ